MKNLKPIRLIIFFAAIIALAKFFEAGRMIAENQTFLHVPLSVLSFLTFILLMLLLGYWIYADEKEKGNLRVTFGLYEWAYKLRKNQK